MINLIRSEWIKFRSVRSTIITLLIAGALVVLVAILGANQANNNTSDLSYRCESTASAATGDPVEAYESPDCGDGALLVARQPVNHLSDITAGVSLAALIFGVLGVQVIGQEYRFNTIRPTFTAAPRRLRVLAAKWVVVCSACATVAAAMVAFCWLVGVVMLNQFAVDGTDRRVALGIVLFTVLWTTAGMGVGSIVRQPVAGIMIIALESILVEPIASGVVRSSNEWLPFSNGIQMTLRGDAELLRPVLAGGIYFAIVCGVLWAIGAYLVNRRDA